MKTKMAEEKKNQTQAKQNLMLEIEIEKVVLSCGAIGDELEKSMKLLELLSNKKPIKTRAKKRIPSFNIRPGLEIGCMVTLRGKEGKEILKKLLASVDNSLKRKKIRENHFSFGIPEYIEIPGMEFQRDIGIIGLNVTVVFSRKGKRVEKRKIKTAKLPKKQKVSQEEIVEYMKKNYNLEVEG